MLVLAAVAGAPAGAATFKLDCAKRTLQAKVNAVPAGSTILVKGTCDPITVDKSLTLDGNPSATIDADGTGRPLTIDGSPTIRLIDLRLTGGNVSGTVALGGGILHPGGPLTLRRVVVFGNRVEGSGMVAASAFGGGIYSQGGPTATIPLLKGSPALNAIPRAECAFGRDQRGVRRPQQKRCDIGAYERRP